MGKKEQLVFLLYNIVLNKTFLFFMLIVKLYLLFLVAILIFNPSDLISISLNLPVCVGSQHLSAQNHLKLIRKSFVLQ